MFEKLKIHFIGIGGIGMSAIAEVLHSKGFNISGSDLNQNQITNRLKKKGIIVFKGHSSSNISDADIIVFSSAIKKNNIEIKTAIKKNIPLYSRASMLSEVMRIKPSITISGSHGKTTTTSLIASILEYSGQDPTIINGGIINGIGANAKLGSGEWIVAEADESDGSFIMLPSTIGVINNIDLEHVDYYRNIKEIKNAFIKYAQNIPFYGFLSVNIDDKNIQSILGKIKKKKIVTYGFSKNADVYPTNINVIKKGNNFFSTFDIVNNLEKRVVKNILIPLLGRHNIINTLSAFTVAKGLKVSDSKIKQSLKIFKGVKRRFSILYNDSNNMIIDDYAHHPKEIKTTLNALRSISKKKLITIFEPHRYSRLMSMKEEFLKSFHNSDIILILPVYSAGEKINKIQKNFLISDLLKKKFKNKTVKYVKENYALNNILKEIISKGDNIIFLGAGNSSKIANSFSEFFKNAK